jgi:hypothetical protein
VDSGGLKPTIRTADHPADIGHLDHKTLNQINHHTDHPHSPQMQTDGHTIGLHQGPFTLGDGYITE